MRVSAELERERLIEARVAGERALVERLEAINATLRRADDEKRRFMATVVHDLRQPLTAMRTTLYLLHGEDDPAARREALAQLEDRLAAVQGLVEELAEYARIEAGQVPWKVERIDLVRLLEHAVDGFEAEAGQRRVRLRRQLDPELGEAWTDAAKLRHVVSNLLSNAIKFSARPVGGEEGPSVRSESRWGSVCVRAAGEGADGWRLEIQDDGVGIPPTAIGRVFEEFYQGPEARACEQRAGCAPGLGLGLAIVRHYAAAMGAELEMQSEPHAGTQFTLRFPRAWPSPPAPDFPAT
jgi:signal transduction histidine kinase